MFSIVYITPGRDGKALGLDAENRRIVRSHAMRHYRREQKNAKSRGMVSSADSMMLHLNRDPSDREGQPSASYARSLDHGRLRGESELERG